MKANNTTGTVTVVPHTPLAEVMIPQSEYPPRRSATNNDVREIADAILHYRDPSKLVGSVTLTPTQRKLISEAHKVAMLRRSHPMLRVVYGPSGFIKFMQGGAPGLVQQRMRRF